MTERDASGRSGAFGLTGALWLIGIALQFATPLLRDRVPLSDDLLIGSFLAPWWLFLQVALLAGVLTLARRPSMRWSPPAKYAVAAVAFIACAIVQPDLVTVVVDRVKLGDDPVRAALIWSTPLFFYVVPALLVVGAWLRPSPRLSMARALAIGLVVIGVMTFPFILWSTHLWDLYIRSSGGETVSRALMRG